MAPNNEHADQEVHVCTWMYVRTVLTSQNKKKGQQDYN